MASKHKHEAPLPTRLYTGPFTNILEKVIGLIEERGPSDAEYKKKAEKAEKEKDYKTAAKCYEKLASRMFDTVYGDPAPYLFKAAEDWEMLGKNKNALKCYQKIVELSNDVYAKKKIEELKKKA